MERYFIGDQVVIRHNRHIAVYFGFFIYDNTRLRHTYFWALAALHNCANCPVCNIIITVYSWWKLVSNSLPFFNINDLIDFCIPVIKRNRPGLRFSLGSIIAAFCIAPGIRIFFCLVVVFAFCSVVFLFSFIICYVRVFVSHRRIFCILNCLGCSSCFLLNQRLRYDLRWSLSIRSILILGVLNGRRLSFNVILSAVCGRNRVSRILYCPVSALLNGSRGRFTLSCKDGIDSRH